MSTAQQLLNKSRNELLDLSTRNRLLSIPVNSSSARIIQVHDELSEQVYRLLVTEKKSLSFLPGRQTKAPADGQQGQPVEDEEIGLPQPDDEQDSSTGLPKRHIDLRLQTSLSS